ncbi:hypothetical protein GCM10010421_46520 [Streptomyces glaucus]|uniref:Transposase n=2 Tax=Streptomyces glaucus TaxID=284029 RepID=A0ABN3K7E2_9ACTN
MPDRGETARSASPFADMDRDQLVALLLDLLAGKATAAECATRAGLTVDALQNAHGVFAAGGYRRLQGRSRRGAKSLALLEKQAAELQRLLREAQSAVEMLRALEQHLGSKTPER